MVTVLFDLQYFGVKKLSGTIQTVKVMQCCTLDTRGSNWQRAMNSTEVSLSSGENSLQERETELRKNMFFHVEKWSQYACLDCKSGCWHVYYIEHQTLCMFSLVLVKTCLYKYFKPWWQRLNFSLWILHDCILKWTLTSCGHKENDHYLSTVFKETLAVIVSRVSSV